MSKSLDVFRNYYQEVRTRAFNNEGKKIRYADVKKMRDDSIRQLQKMNQSGVFQNLQEVDFYKDKFTQLENAMKFAGDNKLSVKEFTQQAQQILKQKGFSSRNSYLSQPPVDPRVSSQPQIQNRVLQSFFEEKKSKIVPDMGFRSLLQNPPISPRNFKKRIGANNDEITRLRTQNDDLKRKLKSGVGVGAGGGNLQQQIRRQQQRIRYLQGQNQRLSRDNTKLRSQKSLTGYSGSQQNFDDYLYSPYVINPRQNDLIKISMRSSDIDTASYYNQNMNNMNNVIVGNAELIDGPSFSNNYRNLKGGYGQTYSEMGDYEKNQDRYSVFDMSKSHYSDYGDYNIAQRSSGSSGVDDPKTAARNKIAFFKNAGVIVRDQDLEIAYKRSEGSNLTANRVILYFNNKVNKPRVIRVYYQFENQYYDFNVVEKVNGLEGLQQAREVVEVRLKGQKPDLNSLIQANIDVDGREYKLWLPVMFVKFTHPREGIMESDKRTKTVYNSKIFSDENQAQKVIQGLRIIGRGEALAWGQSAVHEGPIRFLWKQGNRLQITTSQKWIDMISFLMFQYR